MQNVTLKENILFGKVLNNRTYERAIDACALISDIEILPGKLGSVSFTLLNCSAPFEWKLVPARFIQAQSWYEAWNKSM